MFETVAANICKITELQQESGKYGNDEYNNKKAGGSQKFVYDTSDWVYDAPSDLT